jgi:hypothetical protein
MRTKVTGFALSTLLFSAVAGLTAPPTFATDYFVKYIQLPGAAAVCHKQPTGPRHGTVVFKRTAPNMSATVYLRNAKPNTEYGAILAKRTKSGGCPASPAELIITDSSGSADVQLGPDARNGWAAFWVIIVEEGATSATFTTGEVPAFGF